MKFLSVIKFFIFLATGLLLLWLAFRGQDLGKIWEEIRHANFFWIVLSALISLVAHWVRGLRWNLLIEPLGYHPKASNTFFAVMIGYLANLAFPRIGEIARCSVLSKYERIPVSSLIGTIIAERAIDFITLMFLLLLIILLQFHLLKNFFVNTIVMPLKNELLSLVNSDYWFWLILLGLAPACLLLFFFFWKKIRGTRLYAKFTALLLGFWQGIKTVRSMKSNNLFLVHTLIIWFVYFLNAYLCFFCMESTSHLNVLAGIAVMVFGGLGITAPVQGGIGAYHWIVSQTLVLYGVTLNDGLAFATIVHTSQMVIIIIFGFVSLLLLPHLNTKKQTE